MNNLNLLDQVRAIAQLGLMFAKDEYDLNRYNRLLDLCSREYTTLTGLNTELIRERFGRELGYITPKVGVNGIVFLEDKRVLLERRSDDGSWGIPGGWAEVGETPETGVKRELFEETGIHVEVKEIVQVFTRLPSDFGQPHTTYHLLYRCEITGGELTKSDESLEVGFYELDAITSWHRDHKLMAYEAYKRLDRK